MLASLWRTPPCVFVFHRFLLFYLSHTHETPLVRYTLSGAPLGLCMVLPTTKKSLCMAVYLPREAELRWGRASRCGYMN